MRARIILTLILLPALVGCGGGDTGEDRTQVVAGFYPLAWAAERIGGDTVAVANLTPAGAEPHDVELSARDVRRVRSADVVLYLGERFQPALERAVADADGEAVDLLEGQRLRSGGEDDRDPHVWLDPSRFAGIAERIGETLGRPPEELVAELRSLDGEFREGLADCARREIVTSHAAFGYLAERYGLTQLALTGVSPEAEPTPRQLEELVGEIERSGATTIFFETLVSPRLAETVARETGASTAVLNPLEGLSQAQLDAGEDYLSVMRENLAALRRALECR